MNFHACPSSSKRVAFPRKCCVCSLEPSQKAMAVATFCKLRKEIYLRRRIGTDAKYEAEMPEDILVQEKWPKYLELLCQNLPGGCAQALTEMRKMCPGEPTTLDQLQKECEGRELPFSTPAQKSKRRDIDDIPARALSVAEVHAINDKYLQIRAAFEDQKSQQSVGAAVAEAQLGLSGQAHAYHEETIDAMQATAENIKAHLSAEVARLASQCAKAPAKKEAGPGRASCQSCQAGRHRDGHGRRVGGDALRAPNFNSHGEAGRVLDPPKRGRTDALTGMAASLLRGPLRHLLQGQARANHL